MPERLRASGIGWYNTTVGLLQLVASVVAGLLWDRVGHAAVFYYGAVFAIVGIIALLFGVQICSDLNLMTVCENRGVRRKRISLK